MINLNKIVITCLFFDSTLLVWLLARRIKPIILERKKKEFELDFLVKDR